MGPVPNHRRFRQRVTVLVCASVFLTIQVLLSACVGEPSTDDAWHPDRADATDTPGDGWLIREGKALAEELALSPIHQAPAPFARIGAIWDADTPSALEITVSADGHAWSAWQTFDVYHTEIGAGSSFVGALDHALDGVRFYRLRRGDSTPTFVKLEPISYERAHVSETGASTPRDADIHEIGRTRQQLLWGQVPLHGRASWDARSPACIDFHFPERITIHHTVTPTDDTLSSEARMRQIQSYHMDVNGWCDIGYQYLVSRDGQLWEGRGASRIGAHVGGANTNNVGISFMGTHNTTPVSPKQLDAVAALISALGTAYEFPISATTVQGHRDFSATLCPGDRLYSQLPTLIAHAQDGGTEQ